MRKEESNNWLGYFFSVSLSIIKMKDYEKASAHIVLSVNLPHKTAIIQTYPHCWKIKSGM